MYKLDLALNNLQWLVCHKAKPNPTRVGEYLLGVLSMGLIELFNILQGNIVNSKKQYLKIIYVQIDD